MSQRHLTPAPTLVQKRILDDEPESMSSILLAPLNDLQSLAHTLFLSLSPPQTKPPPPPPLSAFLDCDKDLSAAVNLAHVHQIKQRKIESLEQELFDLEARWREICQELSKGNSELEEVIEEGEERIKATEDARKAAIPYPELLAYAQSLSTFSSAPPNVPELNVPGQPQFPLFFPPFPNEEKMRRGRLNAEAPLGHVGETHSVGRAPTASPIVEPTQHMPGHNPYRAEIGRPQQPGPAVFAFDLDLNPDL